MIKSSGQAKITSVTDRPKSIKESMKNQRDDEGEVYESVDCRAKFHVNLCENRHESNCDSQNQGDEKRMFKHGEVGEIKGPLTRTSGCGRREPAHAYVTGGAHHQP